MSKATTPANAKPVAQAASSSAGPLPLASRQRLSREQSREQTRQRLLEASHAMFIQKGFTLASVEDIAAAAGYTRGAFYSNFSDKIELFFELLRRESAEIDLEFHRMFQAPVIDPVELQEKIVGYYSTLYRDDMCSQLWMEAKIVAMRDEKFRATLSIFLRERHEQIAEFVEAFARLRGVPSIAPAHQIAIGLMALCEGVCFAHRCDPERIDDKTAEAVLSLFLKATTAMPQAAPAKAGTPVKKTVVAKRK
ncbi:transcriptional regulator [Herbaspirillum sp. CF444]|uniref:TetR/AcrR family transcriptional regulator n=1 Tax=Herbaspirillum sp. CF444 TaxID=1144319 RepID=UPI00027239CA|nr:TetR/AcrR family transcriptional regulator [Herbaspirillum sp. CF444]EJL92149.1 transcriptional regulator [Herbaspirillum sp. CF444]